MRPSVGAVLHHDPHGRYPEALTVEDFRNKLAAVRARIDAA